jgi:uncharacterized membrane protein YedE/YeeE
MGTIIEFISQPWHWAVSGVVIAFVMFLMLWLGGEFGVSSNLRTLCSIGGAGKHSDFFKIDWKKQSWNLVFIGGAVIGGFIASHYLSSGASVQISDDTLLYLQEMGINLGPEEQGWEGFVPAELFGNFSVFNIIFLVIGGIFIGFGARYAGGCTSGHAISGLANLQIPSLIVVVGFFIGGILMNWFLLPLILA